jgi:hypothetical protein
MSLKSIMVMLNRILLILRTKYGNSIPENKIKTNLMFDIL